MIIKDYPNHTIENNILYRERGRGNRTIIKPNDKGVYKVRYRQEDHFLTLGQILNPESETELILKNQSDQKRAKIEKEIFNKRLGELCRQNSCSIVDYRVYINKNKNYASLEDFTLSQHKEILSSIGVKLERFYVYELCKDAEVPYNSYKSYLRQKGFESGLMTKQEHLDVIAEYKEHRKKKVNIAKACRDRGVTFDGFKCYLVRKSLWSTLEPEEKVKYIDDYAQFIKERQNNSVSMLCKNLGVKYGNYKAWLRKREIMVSDKPIDWHKRKLKEYINLKK